MSKVHVVGKYRVCVGNCWRKRALIEHDKERQVKRWWNGINHTLEALLVAILQRFEPVDLLRIVEQGGNMRAGFCIQCIHSANIY